MPEALVIFLCPSKFKQRAQYATGVGRNHWPDHILIKKCGSRKMNYCSRWATESEDFRSEVQRLTRWSSQDSHAQCVGDLRLCTTAHEWLCHSGSVFSDWDGCHRIHYRLTHCPAWTSSLHHVLPGNLMPLCMHQLLAWSAAQCVWLKFPWRTWWRLAVLAGNVLVCIGSGGSHPNHWRHFPNDAITHVLWCTVSDDQNTGHESPGYYSLDKCRIAHGQVDKVLHYCSRGPHWWTWRT